jgi:uncharacterized protein YndB with AHSA1/START domain
VSGNTDSAHRQLRGRAADEEYDMPETVTVERTISIEAPRVIVFRFFTDSVRWASWWGAGSAIDARPGGRVLIRYPDGTEAAGEVLDIHAPERVMFTYGFVSGKPFAAGSSRITIELHAEGAGTRLHLQHELRDASLRDEFIQGWRYQLSVFSNLVTAEAHADAPRLVDEWFAAWAEPDAGERLRALDRIATPDVRHRDRFSAIDGVGDLIPHITAAQRFMPGIRIERQGDVRSCQGTALADWVALTADGLQRGAGTNVFVFSADGRIRSVTGFWRT